MSFIGKNPTAGFATIVKDDFTPNGSTQHLHLVNKLHPQLILQYS